MSQVWLSYYLIAEYRYCLALTAEVLEEKSTNVHFYRFYSGRKPDMAGEFTKKKAPQDKICIQNNAPSPAAVGKICAGIGDWQVVMKDLF